MNAKISKYTIGHLLFVFEQACLNGHDVGMSHSDLSDVISNYRPAQKMQIKCEMYKLVATIAASSSCAPEPYRLIMGDGCMFSIEWMNKAKSIIEDLTK